MASSIDGLKSGHRPVKPSVALEAHRDLIRQVVLSHRACNPRVFGSVLSGEDSEDSDLDLLVDPMPETSLLDIAQIQVELEAQLGISVDILTPAALPVKFRKKVLDEARAV